MFATCDSLGPGQLWPQPLQAMSVAAHAAKEACGGVGVGSDADFHGLLSVSFFVLISS